MRAPISRVGNAVKRKLSLVTLEKYHHYVSAQCVNGRYLTLFVLLVPSQGQRFQHPASQQISSCPSFAVYDENETEASRADLPMLVPQPWAALPTTKAKENDLQAGPWNIGRVRRNGKLNC